jgi:hypothetical protein
MKEGKRWWSRPKAAIAFACAVLAGLAALITNLTTIKEAWESFHKYYLGEAQSPLDMMVQLSCEPAQLPITAPQNKFFELELNDQFISEGGAFISFSIPPGGPLSFDPTVSPIYGWRCRFSNYGKLPIINATATFRVTFRAVVKSANGTSSGDIQSRRKC